MQTPEHPLIDPVNGVNTRTVQMLAFHPFDRTYTLWVHNLLEKNSVYIPRYGNSVKPPGWGHPGGGQEPEELERLRERDPSHPILTNLNLSEEDKTIAACGLREFRDETGLYGVTIRMVPRIQEVESGSVVGVRLYSHKMEDWWEDGSKTVHEVVTLWGEVESLARRPIYEVDEIDKAEWIDLSRPICETFRDRDAMPGFLYWSNVRRTLIGVHRRDWWLRFFDEDERCINHLVHPSLRLVFPVGRGDPRFPKNGFRIHFIKWYYVIGMMIQDQIATVGTNIIYELFKDDIDAEVEEERMREAQGRHSDDIPADQTAEPESSSDGDESEENDETPTLFDEHSGEAASSKLLRLQDDEYRVWMENVLREEGLLE